MKIKFLVVIVLFVMLMSSVLSSPTGWRPNTEIGISDILSYS